MAVLAGSLSEAEASRRVWLAAGGLVLLGLVLTICTVWWWRTTRADHPSLAPLEVMSARRWSRAGDAERSRLIDRVRPDGAEPLSRSRVEPVPVDLSVLAIDHGGFDDLREIDAILGLGGYPVGESSTDGVTAAHVPEPEPVANASCPVLPDVAASVAATPGGDGAVVARDPEVVEEVEVVEVVEVVEDDPELAEQAVPPALAELAEQAEPPVLEESPTRKD